jgi:hypothetical protein
MNDLIDRITPHYDTIGRIYSIEEITSGFSGAKVWRINQRWAIKQWPAGMTHERLATIHRYQSRLAGYQQIPELFPISRLGCPASLLNNGPKPDSTKRFDV